MADLRILALSHLIATGAGFALAPRELLETEVVHNGFFETDTKRVLAAAVESLRAENKLLVLSHRGFAAVSTERDGPFFFDGRQELIVPASISYFVDLSQLKATDIHFDKAANVVTIEMPRLVLGDIAFEPERARTSNGGFLTFDQAEVDELSKLNYRAARRAFIKSAQSPTLVAAARAEADARIASTFKLALASVSLQHPSVRTHAAAQVSSNP